jgi:hypothetical protein
VKDRPGPINQGKSFQRVFAEEGGFVEVPLVLCELFLPRRVVGESPQLVNAGSVARPVLHRFLERKWARQADERTDLQVAAEINTAAVGRRGAHRVHKLSHQSQQGGRCCGHLPLVLTGGTEPQTTTRRFTADSLRVRSTHSSIASKSSGSSACGWRSAEEEEEKAGPGGDAARSRWCRAVTCTSRAARRRQSG